MLHIKLLKNFFYWLILFFYKQVSIFYWINLFFTKFFFFIFFGHSLYFIYTCFFLLMFLIAQSHQRERVLKKNYFSWFRQLYSHIKLLRRSTFNVIFLWSQNLVYVLFSSINSWTQLKFTSLVLSSDEFLPFIPFSDFLVFLFTDCDISAIITVFPNLQDYVRRISSHSMRKVWYFSISSVYFVFFMFDEKILT